MTINPKTTALLLVDVQKAFDQWEASGMKRNNPDAVANIALLLQHFRDNGLAVFHARHASTEAGSALRASEPGHAPMDEARERAGEPVLVKSVNSAFIGTDLEQRLRRGGYKSIVIAGITTNHCVETSTRMAGNLGFDAHLIDDACYTFERTGPDGTRHSAEAIHQMTMSNLSGEFATIETTLGIVKKLEAKTAALAS